MKKNYDYIVRYYNAENLNYYTNYCASYKEAIKKHDAKRIVVIQCKNAYWSNGWQVEDVIREIEL